MKIKLPTGQEVTFLSSSTYGNGKIKDVSLEPTIIDTSVGKLELSSIIFYPSGELAGCKLALSAGTQIIDTPVGKLKCNSLITFHESGKLKGVVLARPQIIDTPAGKLKIDDTIGFFENGKISVIKLAEDTMINGIKYSAEENIGWRE